MVTCSKGLKLVNDSNECLKVKRPSFSSLEIKHDFLVNGPWVTWLQARSTQVNFYRILSGFLLSDWLE